MNEIISLAVAEGLWAVLFCGLLVYQLRDNRRRESKYAQIIDALAEKLGTVDLVKTDTGEIRSKVSVIETDTEKIKADTQKIVRLEKNRKSGAVCAENAL